MTNGESQRSNWSRLIDVGILAVGITIGLTAGIQFLDQRTQSHLEKIHNLERSLAADSNKLVYAEKKADSLSTILASKVILKDTLLFKGDGISILNGAVTITCSHIDTAGHIADIYSKSIYKTFKRFNGAGLSLGDQREFSLDDSIYVLTVFSMRTFNGQAGVRVAVYRAEKSRKIREIDQEVPYLERK